MKKIQAIEMNRDELIQILQTLTDSGQLESYRDENFEDVINFSISIEEIMNEREVKEKIAKHLGIEQIRYYIEDENTIILVYWEDVENMVRI